MTQKSEKSKNHVEKDFISQESRKVALKLPKTSLTKEYFGRFRATCFVCKMLALSGVFCLRGWKSPQGLYNRSNIWFFVPKVCDLLGPLQESFGPFGPEIPKKSKKGSRGLSAPGSKKVEKKSKKG